ncbi:MULTISPECIES: autorepressor SdpR family transcription factor [unclassified Dehalobacter]|jgi:DNA-binding transcriptional ArsR family regulator|uniref:autorepressor SdpR family transcription factor n=1 Tax=unclassified Dehalobacter TaxID=2635733 RepID=UPI00037A03A4|nr:MULTISPECIES: autorepressor SdpR family transcription factor [unclassified Dehalobacter]RJE47599.1 transcriptional regulator [Dehalobacter sp. MCB1]TCX48587.1 transcriptional regulator [Dehalobacter sp. 14DCB1]TCX56363.1 transcriptional regulator [Dehalobacter sp. 12DCB1]
MSPYNDTFKALADPTRREMIRFLKERDMTAGEIAEQFKISKPSISHHLNILKQAGLVTDERKGQTIVYALDTSVFEEVMRMMFDLFSRKDES